MLNKKLLSLVIEATVNFKSSMRLLRYFIFACFRKVTIPLFDNKQTILQNKFKQRD